MRNLLLASVVALIITAPASSAPAKGGNSQPDAGEMPGDKAKPADLDAGPADAPKNGGDAGASGAPVETVGPVQDAGLRTFAGPCIVTPLGAQQEAAMTGALAGLIPSLVGTGLDLLTAALESAGADKVTTLEATLPLEHRALCIQVARMERPTTSELFYSREEQRRRTPREAAAWLQESLKRAPFLVEFYLRQSHDGSAIAVMPTVIRYNQSITGREVSRTPRELFATVTFSTVGSTDEPQVTIPLGKYAPQANADPHYFDPVLFPPDPHLFAPTGAAASRWIKSPYQAIGEAAGSDAPADAARMGMQQPGGFASDDAPAPAAAAPSAQQRSAAPAAALQPPAAQSIKPEKVLFGDRTAPYSIRIDLRETRPGNSFAKIAASFLKSGKGTIVDAVDPTKQAAAKKTELDGWTAAQTSYATALAEFYKKRAAYCAARGGESAADLLESQVKLTASARAAGRARLPFTGLIDPVHPDFECGG